MNLIRIGGSFGQAARWFHNWGMLCLSVLKGEKEYEVEMETDRDGHSRKGSTLIFNFLL